MTPEEAARSWARVRTTVGTVIVGKDDVIDLLGMVVLARGHVLVEDLPGLGKTALSRALSRALGLDFTRVQFTPDLLPQDLTGTVMLDQHGRDFEFRPGPVFTQFLLADEINRTPPKTQASLLEAMAEKQVTSDGVTRPLPEPFVVVATSNPIEFEGTYALPEAQLDRFTARIRMGYLEPADEARMLAERLAERIEESSVEIVLSAAELTRMQELRAAVEVHPHVLDYIVAILAATRAHPQVLVGASPRGGLALGWLAQAAALLAGRRFVQPEDIKRVAVPALGHRLVMRPELWATEIDGDAVVAEVVDTVPPPAASPSATPPS